MITALASLALAAPYIETPDAKRTVKIDLYSFGQAVHPYGSDWKPSLLDQWTGILDCEVKKGRVEICRFRGGQVWFGILPNGSKNVGFDQLDLAADLEFVWTKTGRLASYDVRGDREDFWAQASNASLVLFHKPNMVFKPDSQRRIGKDLEQALMRSLASALELDLGKDPEATEWKTKKPMWAGRRYSQDVTATAKYTWTKGPEENGRAPITWSGTVSEASTNSTVRSSTQSEVVGLADWNPTEGRAEMLYTESKTSSTSVALAGHTRWIAISQIWKDGDDDKPMSMPEPRL